MWAPQDQRPPWGGGRNMRGGGLWEVQKRRRMKAGSTTSQEAGRFPSVSPPQSQSRKRGLTPPQPKAEGVPS